VTLLAYALALLIGLALGLLGGGGSILTIPVLHHVMGFSFAQAVPMSLVVVGITSGFGAISHWREGNVRLRTAFQVGVPAILGAVLGASLGPQVRDGIRLTVFGIVLLGAALVMYRGRVTPPDPAPRDWPFASRPLIFMDLIGASVGLLTGFVGVGGGFVYVPALTLLVGLPIKHAVGTSLVLILLSCAAGLVGYLGNPALTQLDWRVVALFTGLALIGAVAGSRLTHFVPQERLRHGFAAFLLILGLVVLLVRR